MSLRTWQQTLKPREELLYNCSEYDKCEDGWVDFPIGMGWKYARVFNSSNLTEDFSSSESKPLKFVNYSESLKRTQLGNHYHTVLCCIADWTDSMKRRPNPPNRRSYLQTLANNGIRNLQMDEEIYFSALPHVKFVISPEGNGIDCHRTYEALMAGCIPIVEEHPGIRKKYEGCPILYTKDYSEINETYLNRVWDELIDKEYNFSKLLLSSYSKEEQEQIKSNGNYWCERLSKKRWY